MWVQFLMWKMQERTMKARTHRELSLLGGESCVQPPFSNAAVQEQPLEKLVKCLYIELDTVGVILRLGK